MPVSKTSGDYSRGTMQEKNHGANNRAMAGGAANLD